MVVLISVVLLGRWRALKDGGRWLSRMEKNEVEERGVGGVVVVVVVVVEVE